MTKSIKILGCIFALFVASFVQAQETPVPSSNSNSKTHIKALGAKFLFMNYGITNDVDSLDTTYGIEFQYIHGLSDRFNIAVPLKLGVANVPGDLNNRNVFSIDVVGQLKLAKPDAFITPYLMGGVGFGTEARGESGLQIPVGAGLNFKLGQNSFATVQGEYRVATVEERNNVQLGLGYIYKLVSLDSDGDGVMNDVDKCPDIPGSRRAKGCPDTDKDGISDDLDKCPDVKGVAYGQGCPDTDKDGIIDSEDKCPEIAGKQDGCPDMDGDGVLDDEDKCPEITGTAAMNGCPDTDGDGVADHMDKCPNEAGTPANMGCPMADRDNDGVADAQDHCPNIAGPASSNGCPDTDGDGVADNMDKCPNDVGPAANKGCPEIKEEHKETLEFAMQAVQFQSGKATLLTESFTVLTDIADILKEYPGYKLNIAGHTDDRGNDANNLALSEQRAKSCYQFLISQGISPARMNFAGYGEAVPRADNATAEGRKLNRRVEFNLYIE